MFKTIIILSSIKTLDSKAFSTFLPTCSPFLFFSSFFSIFHFFFSTIFFSNGSSKGPIKNMSPSPFNPAISDHLNNHNFIVPDLAAFKFHWFPFFSSNPPTALDLSTFLRSYNNDNYNSNYNIIMVIIAIIRIILIIIVLRNITITTW